MILYLDASALVKEYLIGEAGAEEVAAERRTADITGTSVISRVETSAALAKAVRTEMLVYDEAHEALRSFRRDWPDLARINVTEFVLARADMLAWEEGLRGYDAVHLACALAWRDGLGADVVVFAAYDLQLWRAAGRMQFKLFPNDLPAFIVEHA